MRELSVNNATLKQKQFIKPPVTSEEFWKLASFISLLTEEIDALALSVPGVPANAHQVTRELEMRSLVVEAVQAYLDSHWATDDRKAAWQDILTGNEERIKQLRVLAEQRLRSLQLFSTFSSESQLLH